MPVDFQKLCAFLATRVKEFIDQRAAELGPGVVKNVVRFTEAMHAAVSAAAVLSEELREKCGAATPVVYDEIGKALVLALEELRADFPPPEEARKHETRMAYVSEALRRVEDVVLRVLVAQGMPETTLRVFLHNLLMHIEHLIVLVGDLAEQHPVLLETLLFYAAVLLLKDSWLLGRSVLRLGLEPNDAMKGTTASWAQRYFFGATVGKGNWFSSLQSITMHPSSKRSTDVSTAAIGWMGWCAKALL